MKKFRPGDLVKINDDSQELFLVLKHSSQIQEFYNVIYVLSLKDGSIEARFAKIFSKIKNEKSYQ